MFQVSVEYTDLEYSTWYKLMLSNGEKLGSLQVRNYWTYYEDFYNPITIHENNIWSFSLKEDYRGFGLGTYMMKEILKLHPNVWLLCNPNRVNFYERLGFIKKKSSHRYAIFHGDIKIKSSKAYIQ